MGNLFDAYFFSALLMIAFGILFGVLIARRFKLGARLWLIGAAGFVFSQVGHIPFNALVTQLFANGTLPAPPPEWSLAFNAIFLGLSAGLFEELTRTAVFRWWIKDARSWRKGVLFGSGWGGIEAIIVGGLALFTFIYMTALRGMDLSTQVPAEQLALLTQSVDAYWAAPWYARLLGALERLFTIPVHIALSVMVLQAFIRKGSKVPGWLWVVLAILWHALLNAAAVSLVSIWRNETWGIFAVEGVIAIFSLISIGIILALRQPEPVEAPLAVPETPAPKTAVDLLSADADQPVKSDDLDASRYAGS
jgi:uncharacterized membrane protein YhfC